MTVETIRIEEHIVPGRRLGRHIQHDPRSWDYRTETAVAVVDVDHPSIGLPLDQGQLGSCTANALSGAANSQPNWSGLLALPRPAGFSYPHTEADAVRVYERETADEGQPYPPNDPGGTGLAVCRAGRELGLIARWANAFTFDEALRALVMRPVITGVNWYDSFDSPDQNGVISISPDASVRGGHEFVVTQIDVEQQLVGCWNSWGSSWGLAGRFFMSYATWEQLLAEQGDVTVPGAAVAR